MLAGVVIGLIALFSSYDHITLPGRILPLQQKWGIWLIAVSFSVVLVDAELATRARDRAANEGVRAANERTEDRIRSDQERDRASYASERQAQAAERQR